MSNLLDRQTTPFRKNYHIARKMTFKKVNKMIAKYPKQYTPPKYMFFMLDMLRDGWEVKLYTARVSKYVFVKKGELFYKIRFSNHKPRHDRETERDCDFYVGVSHFQVSTTEKILEELKSASAVK